MTRRLTVLRWGGQGSVIALCIIIAGLTVGLSGAVSALIGGVIVAMFFMSTPVVLKPIMRTSPHASLLVALVFFVTKIIALLALIIVLADHDGIGASTDMKSMGLTMGASAVAWTILLIICERKRRVPIYDLNDTPGHSA